MRVRHKESQSGLTSMLVSIHAPVRVRPAPVGRYYHVSGFNSRTREGATEPFHIWGYQMRVSIHAPVRVRQETWTGTINMGTFQFTHP